ncbi:hypothetical protein [Leifsonia sp. TF02-11]|uniref:hypothetical protein n=1 Tax=Leifsonia sp. TF02-11 TaxID=2815212 RepID=UPI001AA193B0|nr:hypothetical protein [Leifsonia sp. TF02-11]MBO1740305.1 hypothetical protein [Leifsonia sp. TF02-11]
MNSNRLWIIGSVLAMVVVMVLGWVLGIQPQLASAAASTAQRLTVDETNARYAAVLAKLKSDHEHLPDLKQQLAQLAASVPADTDSSSFVKELNTVAGTCGVTIKSLTFADAVAYKPPVAPQAAASTSSSGSTATPSPAPSSTTPTAPALVTSPLVTSSNFSATPVQIGVRGSLDQVLNFLEGAQKGARLFLVTTLNSTPSTDEGVPAGTVDATIGGYVYVVSTARAAGGTAATGASSGQSAEASASK